MRKQEGEAETISQPILNTGEVDYQRQWDQEQLVHPVSYTDVKEKTALRSPICQLGLMKSASVAPLRISGLKNTFCERSVRARATLASSTGNRQQPLALLRLESCRRLSLSDRSTGARK